MSPTTLVLFKETSKVKIRNNKKFVFGPHKFLLCRGRKITIYVAFLPNSAGNQLSDIIHLVTVVGPVGRSWVHTLPGA